MKARLAKICPLLPLALLLALAPAFSEARYKTEMIYERTPSVPFDSLEEKAHFYIYRSDGKTWEIELTYPIIEPELQENDGGFSLDFWWGTGGFFKSYTFFFSEIQGEPSLYKIKALTNTVVWHEGEDNTSPEIETETQTRAIQPSIKITELNADKIRELLGLEY